MSIDQQMVLVITTYNSILKQYLINHDKMELCNELKTLLEIAVSNNLLDLQYNNFTLRRSITNLIESEDLLTCLRKSRNRTNELV